MKPLKCIQLVMVLIGLVSFLVVAATTPAAVYEAGELVVEKDIAYVASTVSDEQRLDLYLPPGAHDTAVLIYVHGGGWRKGSKDNVYHEQFGSLFARHGFVTVVPNYRLSKVATHPAQIEDVAGAFAWTVENIEEYGGDPERIFISGHSAGGHLVSLLALDSRYLDRLGVPVGAIKGVLSLSAPYDITQMNGRASKKLAELVFGKDQALWADASPIHHVGGDGIPPFLVLYAQRDPKTLREQAKAFAKALKERKGHVVLYELKREGHLSEMIGSRRDKNPMAPAMLDFMNDLLGPQAPVQ